MADFGSKSLLPSETLFQLQALVYDNYLHPSAVILCRISRDRTTGKEPISDAMKKLAGAIDWPSPHGNLEDFDIGPLVEFLREAQREVQDGCAIREQLVSPGQGLLGIHRVLVTPSRITQMAPR